jgi:hypothetical protein
MPSTYTGSGIELIGDGEQSGSWGNTTNNNLEIINRLVSEAGTIALAGTTHTLSIADGTLSDGQYAVLVFGGAPSGTNTVTLSPNDAKRVFIVKNGRVVRELSSMFRGIFVSLPLTLLLSSTTAAHRSTALLQTRCNLQRAAELGHPQNACASTHRVICWWGRQTPRPQQLASS